MFPIVPPLLSYVNPSLGKQNRFSHDHKVGNYYVAYSKQTFKVQLDFKIEIVDQHTHLIIGVETRLIKLMPMCLELLTILS